MHICIITSTFPTTESDPIGRFAYDFCLTLSKTNEVTVITQKRAPQYQLSNSINFIAIDWQGKDIPLASLKLYSIKHLLYIINLFRNTKRALNTFIKNKKPDYCLALWALPSGIAGRYLMGKYKIPYDVWCLGSDIWKHKDNLLTKPLLMKVLKDARNVYADGYNFCDDISKLSNRNCNFLPSSRRLTARQAETTGNKKIFLFIGRYHGNKGPDVLLQAISTLPKDVNDNCRFEFYGSGPMKSELQNLARQLNLNNVTIHDIIDTDHIADALSKAHFIIIPSRLDSIPVILSDALQGMTPVIGADVGDLGDIIRKHKIGYVFEKENSNELSQMITKACHDSKQEYYEHIQEAMKIFSVDGAVEAFEQNIKI